MKMVRRTRRNNGVATAYVSDSRVHLKGRTQMIQNYGTGRGARSPLTLNLLATLNHPDSYVEIPLGGSRTKGNTIYNIADKAKRAGATLGWSLAADGKTLYAWFIKKGTKKNGADRSESAIEPVAATENPPTV